MNLPEVGQWIVIEEYTGDLKVYQVDMLYLPKTQQYPHVTKQHYSQDEVGIGLKDATHYVWMKDIRFVGDEEQANLFKSVFTSFIKLTHKYTNEKST